MENVIKEYVSIWNNQGIVNLPKVFSDTATYWDATQQGNAIEILTNSVKATHDAFPDISFEILLLSKGDKNQIFLEWLMKGTNSGSFFGSNPTHKKIRITGLDSVKFKAEKVVEIKSFYDSGLFTSQLGV